MKPMVEKSPSALKVLTPARKSWISGTEKAELASWNSRRALPDIDQTVLVTVDQGLEKDTAHQCENRRVSADAKRQRENHRDRQPGSTRANEWTATLRSRRNDILPPPFLFSLR